MDIVIPARLGSTRIKRKLLRRYKGKEVLGWTIEAALAAARLDSSIQRITVCTESDDVVAYVKAAGYEVDCFYTALVPHPRYGEQDFVNGTERCWAYCAHHFLHPSTPIINLQGDAVGMDPGVILYMIEVLRRGPGYARANTMYALREPLPSTALQDPSVVKVVVDHQDNALFFTRLPYGGAHRHCGIYGYYAAFLNRYINMPSGLEHIEALEQMRTLENACTVHCPSLPGELTAGSTINVETDLIDPAC
jgi:3-deoxy-manno-octulosonate cytidylyltransferase (CMP-KDO synthetase)